MVSTPYKGLTAAIEEASKNPADIDWVQRAFAVLASNYVKAATGESALRGVIAQVAETRQSANDLYGSPEEWAYSKITDWKENGSQAFTPEAPWTVKEIILAGCSTGAFFSFLFWLVGILPSDRPSSQPLGFYILPVALGLLVLAMGLIFQESRKKIGFTLATLLTALLILSGAAAIAYGLFASYEVYTWRLPHWTHLLVTLGLGSLAILVGFLLPSSRSVTELADEDNYQEAGAWLKGLKEELWKRGDISDARVREEVSRVQEHMLESGSSNYLEEFGHPAVYAQSLSEQKKVKPYRLYLHSLLMLVIFGLWGYGLYTSHDYASLTWRLPLLLLLVVGGIFETRRNYRAYREAKEAQNQ